MKLKVVIHPEQEGGFSVAVPALRGCYSQGETVEEALANVREAALGWLDAAGDRPVFEDGDNTGDVVREIEL
jgi:predicted RNase H-like HicB family nuclease